MESADKEAVNIAQVILAVRRRCADDGQENLPVLLLQYAIDSKDPVEVKLQNLYAPPQEYQNLLTSRKQRVTRPLGFAL